jgi:hypothetical protein
MSQFRTKFNPRQHGFIEPRSTATNIVLTENLNKTQQCIKILLLILNEAQRASGDTPPIIRSLKLHKQHLVVHNTVEGCRTCSCWTLSGSIQLNMFRATHRPSSEA